MPLSSIIVLLLTNKKNYLIIIIIITVTIRNHDGWKQGIWKQTHNFKINLFTQSKWKQKNKRCGFCLCDSQLSVMCNIIAVHKKMYITYDVIGGRILTRFRIFFFRSRHTAAYKKNTIINCMQLIRGGKKQQTHT